MKHESYKISVLIIMSIIFAATFRVHDEIIYCLQKAHGHRFSVLYFLGLDQTSQAFKICLLRMSYDSVKGNLPALKMVITHMRKGDR